MMSVTPLDDALRQLQQGPVGMATYVRAQSEDGPWETVWLVRDEARRLTGLGPTPAVEFRAGAFDEGGVMVLPILVRLSQQASVYIYDTCLNAFQIEGENIYLRDLIRQDRLPLHLYDEGGCLMRTLMAANSLRGFAQGVLERQAAYQAATQAAFAYARQRLYARYTEVESLWQALG